VLERWLLASESKWFDAFENLPIGDVPGRDRCITFISLLRQFRKDLTDDAKTGEEALARLLDIQKQEVK
jgi:hypothetical protein